METIPGTETMELRPYSQKEFCKLYSICDKTFKRWLLPFRHEIGERNGRLYSVNQVKIIFSRLGIPCRVNSNFTD